MVLVPKYSTEERECKTSGCTSLAIHKRSRCFEHLPRTRIEKWLNLHKRKLELFRTLFGLLAFVMQVIILIVVLT